MGAVGLEPTYPKVPHFECGASTNSTTLPRLLKNNELFYYNKNHFIDYAFGDCLVNSLYAVFEEHSSEFSEKYIDMLKAGGSLRHKELLAPFDLDASDPNFWRKGLSLIENLIDELDQD